MKGEIFCASPEKSSFRPPWLFTKLTLCSQIRNIVLIVVMNLVFIYLGEECLVISYSASVLIL